jgi:hypothetical protein
LVVYRIAPQRHPSSSNDISISDELRQLVLLLRREALTS